jgi:hypothetical protein
MLQIILNAVYREYLRSGFPVLASEERRNRSGSWGLTFGDNMDHSATNSIERIIRKKCDLRIHLRLLFVCWGPFPSRKRDAAT